MSGKSRKQQIEEMLTEDPNDPFLRYGLAMEYVSAGQDEEASHCFEELRRVAPDYVPAYLQAGLTLTRLNREEEARVVYQTGIAVARQQGDGHAADEMARFLEGLS
ncbi:MAG: tetratricopeptide repeat protein [Gemmataceae bacterium]